MRNMADLKITVLKTLSTGDVFGEEKAVELGCEPDNVCPRLKEGAVFSVKDGDIPDKFCNWMWHDIYPEIITLRMGGNFYWAKDEGTIIACCSDGLRPVVVKIERIKE